MAAYACSSKKRGHAHADWTIDWREHGPHLQGGWRPEREALHLREDQRRSHRGRPLGPDENAVGIQQNDPKVAGRATDVAQMGCSFLKAGASFSAGAQLKSDADGKWRLGWQRPETSTSRSPMRRPPTPTRPSTSRYSEARLPRSAHVPRTTRSLTSQPRNEREKVRCHSLVKSNTIRCSRP